MYSFMEMNLWVCLKTFGIFSLSQMILQSGDIACRGIPDHSYICWPPADCLSLVAIESLLQSAQVIMLASFRPSLFTGIKLCIALLKHIATGTACILFTISCKQLVKASHMRSGSCSLYPA